PRAVEADRPDVLTFVECVSGYRAWLADARDQLWPISDCRRPWVPGINTARCNCGEGSRLRLGWSLAGGHRVLEPAPEHPAPAADCECGLYSWRRPRRRWRDDPVRASLPRVIGAVASWGALYVHDDGFRAEHACVVSLAYHAAARPEALAVLERIARRYRVDLVPLDELEEAASRHGTPLPDDLRRVTDAGDGLHRQHGAEQLVGDGRRCRREAGEHGRRHVVAVGVRACGPRHARRGRKLALDQREEAIAARRIDDRRDIGRK